ncbi:MAG: hypothetical protein HPY55_03420 [Firmicutes bacterium]|nr:hypothetical protein [Bacillota bacterium]
MAEDRTKPIELALLRVKDVLYARATLNQEGQIESLHVLARSTRSAARICRDVQSVVKAQFGMEIDLPRISVAQIAGELETAIPPLRPRLQSVFYGVEGSEGRAEINLEFEGRVVTGRARGACSKSNRLRLVAEATLAAVNSYMDDLILCALEDTTLISLSGRPVVVATVSISSGQKDEVLTGACIVGRDELEATARATLDSLNRRIPFHMKGVKGQ